MGGRSGESLEERVVVHCRDGARRSQDRLAPVDRALMPGG